MGNLISCKTEVRISKFADKQLKKLPLIIIESLYYWIQTVEYLGLKETRKLKGYHDEPLKGDRIGQRSIRLNKSYRAIYIQINKDIEIQIIEVNKHDY